MHTAELQHELSCTNSDILANRDLIYPLLKDCVTSLISCSVTCLVLKGLSIATILHVLCYLKKKKNHSLS